MVADLIAVGIFAVIAFLISIVLFPFLRKNHNTSSYAFLISAFIWVIIFNVESVGYIFLIEK